ncbi:MAG: SGNH/GDSL hydrolase family protein [Planctomycetota bacterium]|nr:SGNH/GDSL hydrolase family protein [Planctomycetota bacterium]MDP6838178.1 SGNH/GDSL hydrolase family protein [Planctomycetota bacterium]
MGLRHFMKRGCKALGIALLLCLGVELAVRAAEPGPFSLWDRNPYMDDARHRHRHRPGFQGRFDGTWYDINSLGLRGPELELGGGDGERVIVALGDSCTFGKGVREARSWPRRLEAKVWQLDSTLAPKVVNLGVNGFSCRDYGPWFEELGAPLSPDIVILGFNINDFPNALAAADRVVQKRQSVRGLLPQAWWDALGRTATFRLARGLFYELTEERDWARAEAFARGTGEDALLGEAWGKVEGHLAQLRDAVEGGGGRLAIFLFPYESQVMLEDYQSAPQERLSQTCRELEVPFMDLADVFRERLASDGNRESLFLWGDHYHPNARGQDIVAQAVLELLLEQGWLD